MGFYLALRHNHQNYNKVLKDLTLHLMSILCPCVLSSSARAWLHPFKYVCVILSIKHVIWNRITHLNLINTVAS